MEYLDLASALTEQGFISSISDVSYDSENGRSLVVSSFPVFNFDKIKTEYARSHKINEPKSADALHVDATGTLVLIEFKSGEMNRRKSYEVLEKAYDSALILLDKTEWTLDQLRTQADFVLVYSFDRNSSHDDIGIEPDYLSNPAFYAKISSSVHSLAKSPSIRFGLSKLERHCYRSVLTYSDAEFDSRFLQNARTVCC